VKTLGRGRIRIGDKAVALDVPETLIQFVNFSQRLFNPPKKETKKGSNTTAKVAPYSVDLRAFVEDLEPNEPIN